MTIRNAQAPALFSKQRALPKPTAKPTPPKLSDADVVEMRRLAEVDGMKPREVAARFNCSTGYARSIINYETRVKGSDGSFSLT